MAAADAAPSFTPTEQAFMLEALALAARARYRCHPNPQVGCVVVKDGQVVGRGYHQRRGAAHAEVHALAQAGAAARGADVYVTLEPCNHHGLTPPCSEALVAAGVRRVVAAMTDPDPRTAGQGLARLRSAGIAVAVGLCGEESERLNRPWLRWKRTGQPYTLLKAALSLDGKIATASGESQWLTGSSARAEAHQLRDQADAILVGVGTVLADDPQLTTRCAGPGDLAFGWGLPSEVRQSPALAGATDIGPWQPRHPLRVVLDSQARTPPTARVLPALVFVTDRAPADRCRDLVAAGAEVVSLPAGPDGLVPVAQVLAELGRRGVCSLMAEGGAAVNWSLLAGGLAGGIRFYYAPKLVGGAGAPGPIGGAGFSRLAAVMAVRHPEWRRLGADMVVEADLEPPQGQPDL